MAGVDILNQTMIMETPNWYVLFTLMLLSVGFILFAVSLCFDKLICFISGIICFISLFVLIAIDYEEPIGRYRYEVTITEEASMIDIHERYDVIEKRGQIWVLEDKKVEE